MAHRLSRTARTRALRNVRMGQTGVPGTGPGRGKPYLPGKAKLRQCPPGYKMVFYKGQLTCAALPKFDPHETLAYG